MSGPVAGITEGDKEIEYCRELGSVSEGDKDENEEI